ncbi:MAG: PAS domain S-box protein [Geobacter sp.]|nr:PAS domain S-box protein [Geobacter sp.]
MDAVESHSNNRIILAAFHNSTNVERIRLSLEERGFEFVLAGSGADVLAYCRDKRPDLMIFEGTLHDMGAEQLIAELETITFLPPYVVVVRQVDTGSAVTLMKDGAGDVLPDDADLPERLPTVVSRLLDEEEGKRRLAVLERSLRESEERFRSLAENVPDLLIRFDRNLRHLYLNPAAERFYGQSASDVMGKWLSEMALPAGLAAAWDNELQKTLSSGVAQAFQWEQEGTHGKVSYDLRLIPEFDVLGRVSTILVTGRDITALKRLEEQLYHARRLEAIGTLAGVVAHDLNNLLTPILGYANILKRDMSGDHPLAKGVTVIEKAAERAAGLLSRLLVFARQIKHLNIPVELSVLFDDLLASLKAHPGKNVTLIDQRSSDTPPVLGDPMQLAQVLQHIVSNAIDAMPDGGELRIGTERVMLDADFCRHHPTVAIGPHVCVKISDTGSGIPADVRERIFEPFFSTKGVTPGRGLGLAMVYSIVKSHAGTIVVDSTEGKGTTVSLFLPAVQPPSVPSK